MSAPVLILGFNRPSRLSGLIERLRTVKPERVYVSIDGPRDRPGEFDLVQDTRDRIEEIDWPCDVRRRIHPTNLGCGVAVSSAIDWMFETEERGLILEDDILPAPDFFPFCEEMLKRYENDPRIFCVTGCNFVPPDQLNLHQSYRYSRFPMVWGWGTWRRAWSKYRFNVAKWHRNITFKRLWESAGSTPAATLYWSLMFQLVAMNKIDTWDYQVVLAAFRANGLTVAPNRTLIRNLGFGEDATHTKDRPKYLLDPEPLPGPYVGPSLVMPDERADAWVTRNHFQATSVGIYEQASHYLKRLRQQ